MCGPTPFGALVKTRKLPTGFRAGGEPIDILIISMPGASKARHLIM